MGKKEPASKITPPKEDAKEKLLQQWQYRFDALPAEWRAHLDSIQPDEREYTESEEK